MLNFTITVGQTEYDVLEDLNCYVKKYSIGGAEPILNYVEVPYRRTPLDMTEAVGDGVFYKNRTLTFPMRAKDDPIITHKNIENLFSGKVCKIKVQDDSYYYSGRVKVGALGTEHSAWDFDFTMIADPYTYKDMTVTFSSPDTTTITNNGIPVIPTVTTSGAITMAVNGGSAVSLTAGTHKDARFRLVSGGNTIVTTGDSSVTLTYREMVL